MATDRTAATQIPDRSAGAYRRPASGGSVDPLECKVEPGTGADDQDGATDIGYDRRISGPAAPVVGSKGGGTAGAPADGRFVAHSCDPAGSAFPAMDRGGIDGYQAAGDPLVGSAVRARSGPLPGFVG